MPRITELSQEEVKKIVEESVNQGKTYKEIGDVLNITRERVRQLVKKFNLVNPADVRRKERMDKKLNDDLLKYGPDYLNKEQRQEELFRRMRIKFTRVKNSGKQRGKEVSLTFGKLQFPTHCPILGLELDYFASSTQENSVSFDRIDPSKGYVDGNVVVMSWRANRIKNDGTAEEHLQIYNYLTK